MHDDYFEIEPSSLQAARRSLRHGMVMVGDDVQGVARDLREIDPSLRLMYDESVPHWVVMQSIHNPDGSTSEHLVTTMKGDLDKRIVHRVRQVADPSYDLIGEIEKREAQSDRDNDHRHTEQVGPVAERLLHAMQKDTGQRTRAFIPGD
jgi:hypothetical protein